MKLSFLNKRFTVVLVSVIIGLFIGFKIANSQYRTEKGHSLRSAIAQASGQMAGSQSVNSSSTQNLTPEQRAQLNNQTRTLIDRAKKNPEDVEAQLEAADQLLGIGRAQESLQFLEQAYKVRSDDPRTSAGMGMAYFMMGKYEETIDWSKRSIALQENNPAANFFLIASYIQTNKNLDEAERLINKLESEGLMKPELITRAREELKAVRSRNSGSGRSVLDHAPKEGAAGR
jgi:tetratricopeptide (TPR) repeat protein